MNKIIKKKLKQLDFNYKLLLEELISRNTELELVKDTGIALVQKGLKKTTLFNLTLGSTSYTAAWIASDKFYSKRFLESIDVAVPEGEVFFLKDIVPMKNYAKKIGYPVVLKPLTSSHGVDVISNIETQSELVANIKQLKDRLSDSEPFLLEKHIFGEEYRLFITSKNFFAAVNRIPANVTGDGKHTILELITKENYRRMHPRLNCLCTIKVDDVVVNYLRKQSKSLDMIPKSNEYIQLRLTSNVACGGNCIDVTDLADPSVLALAKNILSKLSGAYYLGVDLICEDISRPLSEQKFAICELNCSPGLSMHTMPEKGECRDVPGAIVNFLFD